MGFLEVQTIARQSRATDGATRETVGSVSALDRSLNLLEALRVELLGLMLSQFSEKLETPKNSAFRITQTLLYRGYLARDESSLAFCLIPKLLKIAAPVWGSLSLPEASREAMSWLRDATGETVQQLLLTLQKIHADEGYKLDRPEQPKEQFAIEQLNALLSRGAK